MYWSLSAGHAECHVAFSSSNISVLQILTSCYALSYLNRLVFFYYLQLVVYVCGVIMWKLVFYLDNELLYLNCKPCTSHLTIKHISLYNYNPPENDVGTTAIE